MKGIPIYEWDATDFGTNGLGLLYPMTCQIEEQANAMFELTLEMPLVRHGKFSLLQPERVLKASAPVPDAPKVEASQDEPITPTPGESDTGEIWKTVDGARVNLRQRASSSSPSLGVYGPAEMLLIEKTTSYWYKVQMLDGGAVGFMASRYLEYSRPAGGGGGGGEGGDVVPEISRTQLFRIYSVETDTDQKKSIARAMHIFYDLRGNLINGEYSPEGVSAATVLRTCFSMLTDAHNFELYIGDIEGVVSGEYGYRSFIDVLLNPEDGILTQIDAHLLRDNYNIYIIPNENTDRGMQVRRGKNLRSLAVSYDTSEVITRIIPVGEDANGNPLYIDGKYVDSIYVNDYPFVRAKKIEYDIKVDKSGDYPTPAKAKEALQGEAQKEFDEMKVDLPAYGMQVDFIMLENTVEFAQYAKLQKVFLFDMLTVIDDLIGVETKLRVNDYVWDALLERYVSLTIGTMLDDATGSMSGGLTLGGVTAVGGGSSSVARELLDLTSGNNDSVMYQALAHAIDLARASISTGTSAQDVLATALIALNNALGD